MRENVQRPRTTMLVLKPFAIEAFLLIPLLYLAELRNNNPERNLNLGYDPFRFFGSLIIGTVILAFSVGLAVMAHRGGGPKFSKVARVGIPLISAAIFLAVIAYAIFGPSGWHVYHDYLRAPAVSAQ